MAVFFIFGLFFLFFLLLIPAATKLGQGNIFTSVCQEFCPQRGGGCLPQCMLGYTTTTTHPLEQSPPDKADTPPQDQTPSPRTRQTPPPDQADPLPPRDQTHPPGSGRHPPPGKQTAAYGQRAAGTHPTGMHSCFILFIWCCFFLHCVQDKTSHEFLKLWTEFWTTIF